MSSEEAQHGLSTDTSVENALYEAVSELHNASDENASPSTAETVSDHAPSPTPADKPQQSTPSGKTTGTSETVNDHAPPSPTPADESQQSTSSGKTTGDSSSSSAIVALLAASVYVESRILTQEEARNRAWWFSLKVPDIASIQRGAKRKLTSDESQEMDVCKKLVFDNDSIELCDCLNDMFIDENARGRSFIGISSRLVATQLKLSNMCISCTCSTCETCTWKGLAMLADLDVAETPKIDEKNGQCDGGLLDSLLQENRSTPTDPAADSITVTDQMPVLGGTEVEQPTQSTSTASLSTSTCSPRPSGIVSKFRTNNLSLSRSLPKKPPTKKSFKGRKSKARSVDQSPAPANSIKQKLLEDYFAHDADWTNRNAGLVGADL